MLRLGVLIHPTRPLDRPLATLRAWVAAQDAELVQIDGGTGAPEVAPPAGVAGCALVVAVGGDGTVLSALRAAGPGGVPVLGVACGSLGALTTVAARELGDALDRFRQGTLVARPIPALEVTGEDGATVVHAINDVVLVRRGTAQLAVDVTVAGERYAHLAGDGVVVATALGSSAYSMAAGGPLLHHRAAAFVCTPLAMHGGSAPPLVAAAGTEVRLHAHPGYGGFDLEVDGRRYDPPGTVFAVRLVPDHVTVLDPPGHEGMLSGLRRRGLLLDSPRVVARDRREGAPRPDTARQDPQPAPRPDAARLR